MVKKSFLQSLMSLIAELFDFVKTEYNKKEEDRPSAGSANVHNSKWLKLWEHLDYVKMGPKINPKYPFRPYRTPSGLPGGLLAHYTGGWNKRFQAIRTLKTTDWQFFCLDIDGTIYQPENMLLDMAGPNAGKSSMDYLMPDGTYKKVSPVHEHLLGLEINCGGILKQGKTWFGKTVLKKERRIVKAVGNRYAGEYEVFSEAQEITLKRFINDLADNDKDFRVENVWGHDEVSGPRGIGYHRKFDPGGSLSVTMDELRDSIMTRRAGIIEETKTPVFEITFPGIGDLIKKNNPQIPFKAVDNAVSFLTKATKQDVLAIVDFDRRSSVKRFYIIDAKTGKLIEKHKVAHGSGKNLRKNDKSLAKHYSNTSSSHESSVGAMVTVARAYKSSKFKYAIRLKGLELGLNDKIYKRAIVLHSSKYVNDKTSSVSGMSWGCLALDETITNRVISLLKGGSLIYVYDKDVV